jgi:hypothetical protein
MSKCRKGIRGTKCRLRCRGAKMRCFASGRRAKRSCAAAARRRKRACRGAARSTAEFRHCKDARKLTLKAGVKFVANSAKFFGPAAAKCAAAMSVGGF